MVSLANGEYTCVSGIKHLIGNEKYVWVSWKEFVRCVSMGFGIVYCKNLKISILGILYFHLWYNHTSSL